MDLNSGILFRPFLLVFVFLLALTSTSCDPARHLQDGQYLLRKNNINLRTDKGITGRGEIKDNIERLIIQKTNKYVFGIFPYRVWLYNLRYEKYKDDSVIRTAEAPVVYDSLLQERSAQHIRSYLFNQGYFYPNR